MRSKASIAKPVYRRRYAWRASPSRTSAAALRARELEANILLKATKVDGVYSDDPELNPHAVRYEKLTYAQVVRDNLRVMDMAAVDLCRIGKLPILVFNFKREGNIERAIAGEPIGTWVSNGPRPRAASLV